MIINVIMWLTLICGTTQIGDSMEIPNDIINTFNYGDGSLLPSYLCDDVSLKVVDKDSRDKKKVTVEKLNKFFADVDVTSFQLKHSSLRDDSGFFIGSLRTSKSVYRINCFFKRVNGHIYIHQIRIDNAKD